MTERERLITAGTPGGSELTSEEFAASTPTVPADRIRCTECSATYVGDERKGTICPDCREKMGLKQPAPLPDGCKL